MTFLTRIGIEKSRLSILVMLLAIAIGASSYLNLPKREDPEIIIRTAIVTAANPGLRLEQLEELVAMPLEEAVRAIPGVDEVRTQLTGGVAVLQVDLADAVAEQDLTNVFDEIRNDMEALAGNLPEGTRGPIVNTDFGDVAVATVAITGEGFALNEIEEAARELRDRLYALPDIAAVSLHGTQSQVVTLAVDRARLASLGATLNPVLAALQGQNVRLPAGSVVTGEARVPLETTGDFQSVEDIENLLVDLSGGRGDARLVRLGDLVEVTLENESPATRPVFQNGRPAIVVAVEMGEGVDITALGPELQAVIDGFVADQPIGIEAMISTFQPEVVEASVNGALVNMAQTIAVVFLVMLVFLGLKTALVVAAIVPLAISFSFALMPSVGVGLQQVSIAAIIISLGILVDNGVVIVEDIQRRIGAGEARRDAALAAGHQYALPLFVASSTTVAAFLPLFLLEGTEGQYGYSLGTVVMLMLAGSYLSALYLLPRLAVWAIPAPKADAADRRGLFDYVADAYGWLVRGVVRAPIFVIGAVIAVVIAGASQMGNVRQQMFPLSDRAQILAYIDLPRGSDIAATETAANDLTAWLTGEENPEVTGVTGFIGAGGPRFVLSLDPADTDPASAFMVINTVDFESSGAVLDRARAYVAEAMPGASVRLKRLAMGGREPAVDVEISGPDADRLLDAALQVRAAFGEVPGLIQNREDWGGRQLTGTIQIAQDRIREYGLTSRDVAEALEGFFDGRQFSTLRQGDDLIPIVLRGAGEDRTDFEAIANAAIEADGKILSLDQFAEIAPRPEIATMRRVDQQRTITVSAIPETMSAYDLLEIVQPELDRIAEELGPAYTINIGGEIEAAEDVRVLLGGGLPVAGIVMVLALMIQFNSFRRVGITLAAVPLVIAGVGPTLNATGQPLSFFGILGLLALTGIIANNVIVLIDQIDLEREENPLNEAIVEAAKKRLRPILLTSLTTVIGLMPMAIAGGALWEPMATLMIGGLGLAALLALFWVPALYRVAFRLAAKDAPVREAPA
ncbi:efflux RND transporter permease subunit [Roseitalea porphyridii]|uniref:Efflux RND transporter permease subunit n=1 Tax=Roseitalea porphyridii TaxID=1852022 RepID=A0A4P6V5B9_9HYPH|nr:efflux RND transporter permease subunit [Roseitalea porphyridii]QBK32014.1 efflux RND transporter permease subunit [Roseitalea porphyridii]